METKNTSRDEKGRFVKGSIPLAPFKKGCEPPLKGKTKENSQQLKKISELMKGNKIWDNPNSKINQFKKGEHNSPTTEFKKGEKSPSFNNWSSFAPYDKNFNKDFKKAIIIRDNNCLICGSNKCLAIHHINYNKLETLKENSICLCASCHTKTNFNRQHWTKFFQSMLSEKYGYKYSEDGKVIINLNSIKFGGGVKCQK